ncbi:unnamed protein product [Mytilus edulis]|uniref:C2H2-type domain-containing protein n=1 Tax=Mytilus edulis TaxID=6550 RepID=A0A8S3UUA3_MYTED|nr:unnamed protein product [Mytilus edulis]
MSTTISDTRVSYMKSSEDKNNGTQNYIDMSNFRCYHGMQIINRKACIALSDIPAALTPTASDCSSGGNTSQLSVALDERVIANVLQQCVNDAACEEFLRDMRTKGLNFRGDTPMDGNCCFWAASDQLHLLNDQITDTVDSYTHVQLRSEMAHFSRFLTVDFKDYMASMKQDGTYADHISLETLQTILKKNIKVIMSAAGEDIQIGDNTSTQCLIFKNDDFMAVKMTSIRKKVHVYIAKMMFTCRHCGAEYLSREKMMRHVRNKHSKTIVECRYCSYKVSSSLAFRMKEHEKAKHSEQIEQQRRELNKTMINQE